MRWYAKERAFAQHAYRRRRSRRRPMCLICMKREWPLTASTALRVWVVMGLMIGAACSGAQCQSDTGSLLDNMPCR